MRNKAIGYLYIVCLLTALGVAPKGRAQNQNCWLSIASPNDTATASIEAAPAWWNFNFNAAANPSLLLTTLITNNAGLTDQTYLGWCIDVNDDINGNLETYSTTLYSSCDTNIDHDLPANYPSSVYVSQTAWHQINYILNHKNGAYFYDIQIAIWNLIGGPIPAVLEEGPSQGYPPVTNSQVTALLTAASNNAASWQPVCGDVIAAIVAISALPHDQLSIIEVPYPCVPCISVTKEIACLQPTNNCGEFGQIAYGYAGTGCSGIDMPAFCYQISITNCGTTPLTNLVVSDNLLGLLTTNFFTNETQVLQPGAGVTSVFSMSFATNATNTVIVYGDAVLAETATNLYNVKVTNGTPVSASGSAVAVVSPAAVTCSLTLSSPLDLDGNPNDNDVILPAASYYSTPPTVTLSIQVCNTGQSALNNININLPALAAFNCSAPGPFSLGAGACQSFQLCLGVVNCPAQMNFDVTVTGQVASDTNHCGVYDLTSTNLIGVCSSCAGSISCTNCMADLSGSVLLDCSVGSTNLGGDAGLSGLTVTLYGATTNALATNTTDANGNFTFTNLAAGIYYVQATVPTNYVQTYPLGTTNNVIAVTMAPCTNQTIYFGYANTLPPVITVVPGSYLGCNPANLPTVASVASNVTAIVSCGSATSTNITSTNSTNGCLLTETFTIIVTDTYGNSASNTIVYTWTADTAAPVLSGVPAGTNYGCNPTNVLTASNVQAVVTASDTCSPATVNVTEADSTNGCLLTQIFTIIATNACGNTATAYVTNTWTANATPPTISGMPLGANLGCNPTNVPSSLSGLSASNACGTAAISQTNVITTNGCAVTQVFTVIAVDGCGNTATASVTNTWTANATPPTISGMPLGADLGCNPTNVPTSLSGLSASNACGTAAISQTNVITTNGCGVTQVFTVIAVDGCGNTATASVTNTWTANTTPPTISGMPLGADLGCNPTNVPSSLSGLSASNACGTAEITQTNVITTNGCAVTQVFTVIAVDGCGNTATANVTNTWTANATPPTISGMPLGANLGCNPTNVPSSLSGLSASNACGTAAITQTNVITTNGCAVTQVFTVIAVDGCGNTATANVTNTWTANATPPTISGMPLGANLGCNPTNVPSSLSGLSASNACGTAAITQTNVITTNGCAVTQVFTVVAVDGCGNTATASVTNTWTSNTTPPTISGMPLGANYGCNPTNVPSSLSGLSASNACGSAAITQTNVITTNGCAVTQVFTVIAVDGCGNTATASVTNTWTSDTAAPVLTNVPVGANLGCNPTNIPTAASVQAAVKASDTCSTPTVNVTGACTTNSCAVTQIFTIIATDACGNSATAYVTNTWTADVAAPVLSGVPAGKSLGCNPTNIPTASSVQSAVSASDTCSPATVHVTGATSTNGCAVTQVLTIVATNACGNAATAYVTNTWTADTAAPVLSGVPAGKSLGCNPTNIPTAASVQSAVSASDTCSPATVHVTSGVPSTNGCAVTQVFTVIATNACGNSATAYVTNTWTADTTAPVLSGVPAGKNLGCNPTNVPVTITGVTASDTCSPATVHVTGGVPSTNGCGVTQVFTIIATNACGNIATAYVTNTWTTPPTMVVTNITFSTNITTATNITYVTNTTYVTNFTYSTNITITTNGCTNSICGNFNSQNPGTNCWLWLNAHASANPGTNCTIVCTNSSVTLACANGVSYSYPVSNCIVKFSSSCNTATNWFDGTNWNTTLPCAGDDQIFLHGCAIPWQSAFANCQSVCWTAVFSSSTPGFTCDWQWGAACYNNSLPACGSIAPKACHQTACQNGQYYSAGDQCGTPENCKPYCVGGGTGGGGANCTGSWSGTSTTCTFGTKTNITVTTISTVTTNKTTTTNITTTPVTTVTTNTTVATVVDPPVLSGVPVGTNFGCNPANVPTVASVQAAVSASETCSAAAVQVTQAITTNGCNVTQIFTLTAVNGCGNSTTANVTNFWTANTIPPVISGVPVGGYLGCGNTNVPGDTNVLLEVSATGHCGTASLVVSHQDSTNGCLMTRTFTITATDACGNMTTTNLVYTYTGHIPELCTNSISCGFNSQNPGSGWLWCNAHVSGKPGSNCTLTCQNATVTLNCSNGQSYTYPVPNGAVNFSSTCTVGTNWFDGANWNTTLPCGGDDQIFLQGCAIPWQSAFAGCKSVTWTGVFSCTAPGQSFNWQWGGACYANSKPAYTNICPKACHNVSCQNGQYYNSGDQCGTPENCKPYCVGGATGGGGANCTGSWSGTDTTCTFTAGTLLPPVLNGIPANDCLGINPTNIPTVASVLAVVTATDTCSPAPVSVTVATTTNSCLVTQIFTITATNVCGGAATAHVTNTWTTLPLVNHSTNTICSSFNSQNPGSGWLWLNCQLTGKPGSNEVFVVCSNATVTLSCNNGKTYTYPVPNGQIHFSPSCTNIGTNWFDGTNWNTTLPCGGDDQIFVSGCAIPWQSAFAGCQSVCWNGVFCCNQPGLSFNWQFGAACYNNSQPSYNNICPKACHQTPCQNGQYYNQNDNAGCPENHSPYCVGGGTGYGGSNCTGNFSSPGTCKF